MSFDQFFSNIVAHYKVQANQKTLAQNNCHRHPLQTNPRAAVYCRWCTYCLKKRFKLVSNASMVITYSYVRIRTTNYNSWTWSRLHIFNEKLRLQHISTLLYFRLIRCYFLRSMLFHTCIPFRLIFGKTWNHNFKCDICVLLNSIFPRYVQLFSKKLSIYLRNKLVRVLLLHQ